MYTMYALKEHRVSMYFLLSLVSYMDTILTHTDATVWIHLEESSWWFEIFWVHLECSLCLRSLETIYSWVLRVGSKWTVTALRCQGPETDPERLWVCPLGSTLEAVRLSVSCRGRLFCWEVWVFIHMWNILLNLNKTFEAEICFYYLI